MKSLIQKEDKEKRFVDVKIMGQKFTVKSDQDEVHLHRVVDYLNKKIEEIQSKTQTVGAPNLAILAALNIADDYLHSKSETEKKRKLIRNRGKRLIEYLDKNIK